MSTTPHRKNQNRTSTIVFQQAALRHDPEYSPKGIGTDGFDSTRLSLRTLFPKAAPGNCWRHAAYRLEQKLQAASTPCGKY